MEKLNLFDRLILAVVEFVASIRVTWGEGGGQAEWR